MMSTYNRKENGGGERTNRNSSRKDARKSWLSTTISTPVLVLLLSILAAVGWITVDANLSLFLYVFFSNASSHYFEEKTVWVTGASSGIGAELVCQLQRAKAKHVVLSARNAHTLNETIEQCLQQHDGGEGKATTTFSIEPFDAIDFDADTVVAKALEKAGGGIDVLILNAGIYQVSPALQTSFEETRKIMKVNFEAPVALSTALMQADHWKERGYGHLLVVSSLMARGSNSLSSSYSASKHALRGYFHSLSTEESSWLRVDVAMPGATDTNLWSTNFKDNDSDAAIAAVKTSPAGKMPVERCAQLILTGAAGPHWMFYETWIAQQPGLLWVYQAAHTPDVFHFLIHFFGSLRVEKWVEDRSDIIDLQSFVRQIFK